MEGKIIQILEEKDKYQKLKIFIEKGEDEGKEIVLENGGFDIAGQQMYKTGESLVIQKSQGLEGEDVYFVSDYVRRDPLGILLLLFIFFAVIIGKKRGFTSLLGMVFSFFVIFAFILPSILSGQDPVLIATLGSLAIIPITFFLSHGINKKTIIAIAGTCISLIITAVLASVFVDAAKLTGFASEEAGFLQVMAQGTINIKGLLLAGIIIGSLGVLDDITVSQSSIVAQLKLANKNLKVENLFKMAMDVGQDHISSMVNTLILVYTGASLPLLLLFMDGPGGFLQTINYEIVADEIVRTLVGSIGLILAVPITTFIAVFLTKK